MLKIKDRSRSSICTGERKGILDKEKKNMKKPTGRKKELEKV